MLQVIPETPDRLGQDLVQGPLTMTRSTMIRPALAHPLAAAMVIGAIALPFKAIAHSVETDYLLDSRNQLSVTSKFSTGDPLPNAKVVIYAPDQPDKPWIEGTTDANGTYAFQPDPALKGEWKVRIGQGDHGDILYVPVSAQGIEVDKISQLGYDTPHSVAGQMALMGAIAVASGLGTTAWLKRRGS